ncbi:hypothetical protein F4680DRAFT_458826 [Xylaria scruposa]|nr:hypothetical protein F4680DRAFT_458826 [Xylaria scruposa]
MSSTRPDSPEFDFCDDGGRPKVITYITSSKFRTGDKVYLQVGAAREGPYIIATVPSAGRYTLCLENGQSGCVRDVREIGKYVNSSLSRVHMQLFTADTSIIQSEVPEILATYANIKVGFQNILSVAAPGNYVYVHYSGHGVRMEASREFSNRTTGDLALNVLEDSNQEVTRPFPGVELALILNDMVTKGLIVTLVLDCCFSGSVLRNYSTSGYSSVRYREYGRETITEDIQQPNDRGRRKATMLPNWLVNPEGYTVITACGPHEIASELNLGGATSSYRHGALSYFLLRAMARLGGLGGRHAHIYPYLCSMFRQFRPTQNPMWYGNKDLYFFGGATFSTELIGTPFPTTWIGTRLQLEGGRAHGICNLGRSRLVMGPSRVLDIVEHLAKFQLVRDLTNESQDNPFRGRYRAMVLNQAGHVFQSGDIITVRDQELLHLVVENEGNVDLYVHVYNLGPLGQVENILKASYVVISPLNLDDGFTGEWVKKVQMEVPPVLVQQGIASCEDIIKVFITSQPTSFAPLEMQKLDESYDIGVIELPDREHTPFGGKEDWVALDFRIRTHWAPGDTPTEV